MELYTAVTNVILGVKNEALDTGEIKLKVYKWKSLKGKYYKNRG
jgi:hypothetical protein